MISEGRCLVENNQSDESTEIGENRKLIKIQNRTLEDGEGTIENILTNEPGGSRERGEEEEQINLYIRLNQLIRMGNK